MTPEQIEKCRTQFESWIKSPPYERRAIRFGASSAWPGSYASIDIDLAWQAWQECARLVAQDTWERAAAICDDMVKRSHSNAAVLIAAAENIRAAAAKEKS